MGAFLRAKLSAIVPDSCSTSSSCIPQHIGHDEKAHVRTTDVYAVQVGDSAIALGDVDVLHLHVHVVLSYVAMC
jgi:hypothetical protein